MNVGIVVAMTSERRHLLELASNVVEEQTNPRPVHSMRIGAHNVLAVTSGIGLINAAAAAEWLICSFEPNLIMNYGCAGSHRRDVVLGDVVIANELVNHTAIQVLPDGSERFTGFIDESDGDHFLGPDVFPDHRLVELAQRAAAARTPEPWPYPDIWPPTFQPRDPVVITGPIASADVWTQQHSRLDVLHDRHGSVCEEMEAVAIGRICQMHGISFLAVKDISNNEYHRPSDLKSFQDFPVKEVGKRAARVVVDVIEQLPDRF
jgi:adenosylhomocysteine nucleosidase